MLKIKDENGNIHEIIALKGESGYTPQKGVDYFDGKDGKTPVKGTDYWTAADKEEMAEIAAGMVVETDPTVPSWAKASTKPTYTASEVGADASGTASSVVSTHNSSTSAHADIRAEIDGKADKSEGAFYIEGSGTTDSTAKTSTWVGTSDRITEYYDGLTIRYKIGVAGQSTVTLNINNLGAKTIYRFSTTKLTTQFPVGSIIHLVYHEDLNDGCWVTNDYDANTNTYQRVYASTTNKEYPITARYNTTTGETYYAEYGRYATGVTLNPSTKTITATAFKGNLTGNADTATKATQDASGNVITTTYETKADANTKINDINTQISQLSSEKADKSELTEMINNAIADKVLSAFEFVESKSDFTDTNKMYVLPDGSIHAWIEDYYVPYTNLLPTAKSLTDMNIILKGDDGSIGYLNGVRTSGDGTYHSTKNWDASGLIRANAGDVVRIKNMTIKPHSTSVSSGNHGSVAFYLEDGTWANSISLYYADMTDVTQWGGSLYPKFDENNNIIEFTVPSWNSGKIKYILLTCQDITNDSIITVNEEIVDPVFTWVWSDTGFKLVDVDHNNRLEEVESNIFDLETRLNDVDTTLNNIGNGVEDFSEAWNNKLLQGVQSINEAMLSAGCNKSAFLFYSDAHLSANSMRSPKLLKHLYRNTAMTKTIFGGDAVQNEGDDYTTMQYLWEWRKQIKDLPNHHSVVGNHDDGNGTGNKRFNEQYVYGYLLAPEETPDIVRNDSGLYYYIDSPSEKTRYLYLDTGNLDENSLSTAQSDFIKSSLKNTKSGWHIVVIAHIWFMPDYNAYYYPEDGIKPDVMPIQGLSNTAKSVCTILNDYNNRVGEFSNCDAKVEFCIGGHVHIDFVGTTKYDTTNDGIPIIVIETDSDNRRNKLTHSESEGTNGSVNGIIANYNTRTLHVVRVGRGNSFTVDLDEPVLITTHAIVNNLTNVSSSSDITSVIAGDVFTTTLTVTSGEMKSVTITMGGTDVTSTVYNANTGVINISKVTGDVIITAVAEEVLPAYTNVLDTASWEIGRLNSSGQLKTDRTDRETTGFIYAPTGSTVYFKNITMLGSDYGRQIALYDSNQTFLTGKSYIVPSTSANATWYDDGSLKSFKIDPAGVSYVRFSFVDINENSIITVNEPIE